MDTTPIEIVSSACPHDCPSTCALEVERIDARSIARIHGAKDNSYTDGVVCAKVARYAERVHHPFGANPFEGGFEAFGVVNSFGIPRDLGADHAIGVAIVLRTVDAGDRSRIDPLNFQRASRRTIVGTCRRNDLDGGGVQGMFQLRAHAFIQGNVLSTAQQWYRQRQQTVSALLIGGPQNACYVADLMRILRVER